MSFTLPKHRPATSERPGWASAAFIVESLLLLVFLVGSLAVFTQMFAASAEQANEAGRLSAAVAMAGNTAERFAADPASIAPEEHEGDLRVVSDVTHEESAGGTLYHATISVYGANDAEPVYTVTTSRYVSGVD
ncbi:MAG: hypothetical protein Q3963_02710 [Coriobacteriaceae bacterium]|nr:hypothetical protein [Coriobacteriaceae bacterium]